MTKATNTSTPPDANKKEPLLAIFRAAIIAQVDQLDGEESLDTVTANAKKNGVTDQDLNWLDELDGAKFRAFFGAAALDNRLEKAMRLVDENATAMNYTPQFKNRGFYK
jgi:cell division inhibitor SulA